MNNIGINININLTLYWNHSFGTDTLFMIGFLRLGFNGSAPVRFLAQYSIQTLIWSRSWSTSVTVRFGLSFGLKFSNVKFFEYQKVVLNVKIFPT